MFESDVYFGFTFFLGIVRVIELIEFHDVGLSRKRAGERGYFWLGGVVLFRYKIGG